jgi:hypothetical protein
MPSMRRISYYVRPLVARPRTVVSLLVVVGLVFLVAARAGSPGRAESRKVSSSGVSTIVIEGDIVFYPSGAPGANVSVTISTTTNATGGASEAPDGAVAAAAGTTTVIASDTVTTGADGHYSFTVEAQCNVTHEITAVSTETPDGESLPPSKAYASGCVTNDTVLPPITISRPVPITFDGYIKYTDGSGASGVTVTMTRTKHDLGQTTTETKTTGAGGYYQFQTWSRCNISYEFRPTLQGRTFAPPTVGYSGCVFQSYNVPNMTALGTPPPPTPTPTPTPCPTCQCPAIPIVP